MTTESGPIVLAALSTAGSRLVSTWVVGQADNFTVVDTHKPIANLASLTEGHVQPDFIGRKVVSAMAWSEAKAQKPLNINLGMPSSLATSPVHG
uniref:Uncharacterized protein n=1 Tax=Oryza meridionalis TaxID=40149 RepID=A0A0E0EAY8_9ORYZ